MEDKIGYIYKLTAPNNKIYIGQTINPKQRKYNYKHKTFKGHIKLWNNCQAYDWNPADTFEVIEECSCGENKVNLNKREIYWIAFYDSFHNGLNCNKGGNGNAGYKYSEESKKKISNTLKEGYKSGKIKKSKGMLGKLTSEETKKRISETIKKKVKNGEHKGWQVGHKTWNKGKVGLQTAWNKDKTGHYVPTEEIKKQISNSLKEKYSKQEHPLKGKKISEEHKEKLRGKMPHNKGKKMEQFECPHCGKKADEYNLKRWHLDKCRSLKDII